MKRIALALALCLVSSAAFAQCNGVFSAGQVCGSIVGGPPKAVPSTGLPPGAIIINSTAISGGTNLRVLYDNSATVGEYTNAQVTALINLATTSLSGALPAWPNNTTTFFRGDGTYATLNCAALTNSSPSCATDATNAANITSGTLGAGRLPAFGSGDVSFAIGGGAGTIAVNAVTNAKAAQVGANTVKGNWTAGTANVADNTMPSCADSGGNHLNYVNGTGVTCGSTSVGTAFVLLNTLTASTSATLSDTTSFTSSYSSYQIIFTNIIPDTNNTTFELQVHSGGAFKSTGYLSTNSSGSTSTTFVLLSASASASSTTPGLSSVIFVTNPSGTAAPKIFTGTVNGLSGGASYSYVTGGWWNGGNGAVDGFQVLFSTGNILSGTIKIYGIL